MRSEAVLGNIEPDQRETAIAQSVVKAPGGIKKPPDSQALRCAAIFERGYLALGGA